MSRATVIKASRAHPGFVAALVHRLSGLALAIFLPVHFLVLGLALEGEVFSGVIAWTNQPLVKVSEALLVGTLAVHFAGGTRLLAIEFFALERAQAFWISAAFAFGLGFSLLFAMRAF